MAKAVEVITSVERRRRWSRAEKERIVAAAMEPAVSAAFLAALILIGIGSAAVWGTVVGAVLISAW